MRNQLKRAFVATFSILVALSLAMPALSFAESNPIDPTTTSSGNCTATIEYYENVIYVEPGVPPNEDGRYLLGTRTITGLQEGTELSIWDYVADIPGYFLFDGWPATLTVSSNPEDNVFEIFYFRYSNYSYSVNYYLMTGADLTADNWTDALKPSTVEFHKMGTETFFDQPYGKLVEGDEYEYPLEGTYVIDTYPSQLRVGVNPGENAINVLYTPSSTVLPDDWEIPIETMGTESVPPAGGSSSDSVIDPDKVTPLLPTVDGGTSSVPPISGVSKEEIDNLFRDYINASSGEEAAVLADSMLDNPLDRETLQRIAEAYKTGYKDGVAEAEDQQMPCITDHILCIILIVIFAILAIIGFALYGNARRKLRELQGSQEAQEAPEMNLRE